MTMGRLSTEAGNCRRQTIEDFCNFGGALLECATTKRDHHWWIL